MGLTSFEFILSLPIVVLLYYLIPTPFRQYYLLVINMLFYCSFGWRFAFVVAVIALIIWSVSLVIRMNGFHKRINSSLFATVISIMLLVTILLIFRIGPVMSESIVPPLGLSFYSLQAISYIVDVKRGDVEPETNIIKLITYLSFFPTITSGPIYRYKDFSREHNRNIKELKPEYDRIINGILYMLWGYFLKLVVSARAAIAVDKVFGDYRTAGYGGLIICIVACLYSLQIYTDFAGYSAIVIGLAQIIGYRIPENFSAPYFSMSVKEFWGRWHISLSSWLKDYVYIPLGGNRKGRFIKYINILITFLISGIWHGVNGWHYLVWGLIHGIYQIAGDITKKARELLVPCIGIVKDSAFHRILKRIFTFAFVTVAWIFFRTGVGDALSFLSQTIKNIGLIELINGGLLSTNLVVGDWIILFVSVICIIIADTATYYKGIRIDSLIASGGSMARCCFAIAFSLIILILGVYGDQHDASYFIYRDF